MHRTPIARAKFLLPFASSLVKLTIKGFEFKRRDTAMFAKLFHSASSLRSLELLGTHHTGKLYEVLPQASSITSLAIRGVVFNIDSDTSTAPLWPDLSALPNLASLVWSGSLDRKRTEAGFTATLAQAPQLTELDVSDWMDIASDTYIIESVAKMTNLTRLGLPTLGRYRDGVDSSIILDQMPSLTSLKVDAGIQDFETTDLWMSRLEAAPARSLQLSFDHVGAPAMEQYDIAPASVIQMLTRNSTLTDLRLTPYFENANSRTQPLFDVLGMMRNTTVRTLRVALYHTDYRAFFNALVAERFGRNIARVIIDLRHEVDSQDLIDAMHRITRFIDFHFWCQRPGRGEKEIQRLNEAAASLHLHPKSYPFSSIYQ